MTAQDPKVGIADSHLAAYPSSGQKNRIRDLYIDFGIRPKDPRPLLQRVSDKLPTLMLEHVVRPKPRKRLVGERQTIHSAYDINSWKRQDVTVNRVILMRMLTRTNVQREGRGQLRSKLCAVAECGRSESSSRTPRRFETNAGSKGRDRFRKAPKEPS